MTTLSGPTTAAPGLPGGITAAAATNEFFSGALAAGAALELDWPCSAGITVSALTTFVGAIAFS